MKPHAKEILRAGSAAVSFFLKRLRSCQIVVLSPTCNSSDSTLVVTVAPEASEYSTVARRPVKVRASPRVFGSLYVSTPVCTTVPCTVEMFPLKEGRIIPTTIMAAAPTQHHLSQFKYFVGNKSLHFTRVRVVFAMRWSLTGAQTMGAERSWPLRHLTRGGRMVR